MKQDKFDTFIYLLGNAFAAMSKGEEEQHVTIISSNGYNLTINMVQQTTYPEIVKNMPKLEFSEINFVQQLPREFGIDLTTDQLAEFYTYLKTMNQFTGMGTQSARDALFLFTDKIIVLLMRETYDKTGLN